MIDTVLIKSPHSEDNPHGYIVINKDDYDADKHDLFDAPKAMTVADLKDALTAKGVTFDPAAKKADLQALLDA